MSEPVFAVVGHPNKGKSSIVSTLASDDSVVIKPDPGTTIACRRFPMTVDGVLLYTLVDTPGFERARRALQWMKERETDASKHPDVVRDFVQQHRNTDAFPRECELLTPLVEGAGLLYVVDGSVPYGPEYEAEMKILRWTGQPSMGLINPIGGGDYIEEWRAALGQYFSVVRVFNAVYSEFGKRSELLKAFGQLREEWRQPLQQAVASLGTDRAARRERASRILAASLEDMLTLQVEKKLGDSTKPELEKEVLELSYRNQLQRVEGRSRDRVEEVYDHHKIDRQESDLELLDQEHLFSEQVWRLFGLTNRQLLTIGAISGGAVGGAVDVAVGGTSFFLGSLIGAGVGAATTFFAGDKLSEAKIMHIPLGGRKLVVGPTKSVRFPHVVFQRARLHHALVANRTHAARGPLRIEESMKTLLAELTHQQSRQLEKSFSRLRKQPDDQDASDQLYQTIYEILEADDQME